MVHLELKRKKSHYKGYKKKIFKDFMVNGLKNRWDYFFSDPKYN